MSNVMTQFLFIVPDTDLNDNGVVLELERAMDGDNFAMIMNTSNKNAPNCLVRECLWKEKNKAKIWFI